MRYLLALVLLLRLYRPRARGKITRAFQGALSASLERLSTLAATFWGWLKLRWKRRENAEPKPNYEPRHRKCEPPRVLTISPLEIGMAWTLLPKQRVSARHDDTMPAIPVFREDRIRRYLYAAYRPGSA
jgi:hypothetical protein